MYYSLTHTHIHTQGATGVKRSAVIAVVFMKSCAIRAYANMNNPRPHTQGFLRVPRNVGGRGQFGLAHRPCMVIKSSDNPPPPEAAMA